MSSQPVGVASSSQNDDVSSSDDSETSRNSDNNTTPTIRKRIGRGLPAIPILNPRESSSSTSAKDTQPPSRKRQDRKELSEKTPIRTDVSRLEKSPTPRSPANFSRREEFLLVLERTERRTYSQQLNLNLQQTPENRDQIRYIISILSEIIGLTVSTIDKLDASSDARFSSLERQFYDKLGIFIQKLEAAPLPHQRQDEEAEQFVENRRKMIERSLDIENELIERASVDVRERHSESQDIVDHLLYKASGQFDQFRERVARATTNEEIERLEEFVYFGNNGTITKLKEMIGFCLNNQ